MNLSVKLLLGLLVVGAACASKTAALPPECFTTTDRRPPFALTIRFSNDGTLPVFLRQDCVGIAYGVSSCANGFQDLLGPAYHCGCSCSDATCTGPVACGQCQDPAGVAVASGEFSDASWSGTFVTDHDRGAYSCVSSVALAGGGYRLAVNVYDSGDDALRGQRGHLKTVDFPLPVSGDVLTVPLTASDDVCDPDPGADRDPCVGSSREIACSLPERLSWGSDGGLVAYRDSSQLEPPANYTRTRTFVATGAPSTASCDAAVPRCSRDARVVTTSDMVAAFDQPDVKAAFGRGGTLIYGFDSRPIDGSILMVSRAGASFGIGGPCQQGVDGVLCHRSLPAGLARLAGILERLDSQESATVECGGLPTSPAAP